MASYPQHASHLELHESKIPKPQPLRIIKRSQTITGCSTPREIIDIGRGLSGTTNSSRGSPPFGADRPLTVHKIRKGRGSIFNSSVDGGGLQIKSVNTISDLIKRSAEQKALQEDQDLTPKAKKPRTTSAGQFLKSELQRDSSEANTAPFKHPLDEISFSRLNTYGQQVSPNIPERRPSKSKSIFLKVIGSRKTQGSIPMVDSAFDTSKGTVLRRLSRSRSSNSGSISAESSVSAQADQSAHRLYPKPGILAARILVTPEVNSIDDGTCALWVAVEVIGTVQDTHLNPLHDYGRLHSMRIDLLPGRDCIVSEIVGNLYELKTLAAGETHLILVKLRLPGTATSNCARDFQTTDELISDLETQLGGSFTSYLTVRLTYQHSGCVNLPITMQPDCGSSFHTTSMRTEAGFYIRRNLCSVWSPRNSPEMPHNPLISLIEIHFPLNKAREIIRKLAEERVPIPNAHRAGIRSELSSSEDTVKDDCASNIDTTKSIRPPPVSASVDPARKIWTEMRKTSRGRHHRASVSAGTFTAPLDNDCSPSRISARGTMEEERNRIKQVALRNKRSVGADTLRSIAPSIAKPKAGSVAGGLGLGGSWGWGGSWW